MYICTQITTNKKSEIMFIENYKNENIYKFNGFYQIGINGASCSNLTFLKKLIDLKK